MVKYEVVEYVKTRTICFDDIDVARRYLIGIEEADLNNLYFIEVDGEAIE